MKRLEAAPRNDYCANGSYFSRLGISFREWYRLVVRTTPIERYYLYMAIEGLQNYLGAKLPLVLGGQQLVCLLRTVFVLVFLTTLAIHVLVEQEKTPLSMLAHAVAIGFVYVIAVGLATSILNAISGTGRDIRVWHVWLVSLSSFVLGYFFVPIDDWMISLLGVVVDNHAGKMEMSQLLPVWFAITYVFIQPYLSEGVRLELSRLRDVNHLLESNQSEISPGTNKPIVFESGRTEFSLDADAIRNVVVEDHYCYVHYRQDGSYAKRDLAMPLRDVKKLLPEQFLLVHRSHVVNPKYIKSIRRGNRRIRVVLHGEYEVPVSRHRLEHVLPLIRKQIDP